MMKKKYTPKLSNIKYQFVIVYWVDIESDSNWRELSSLLKDQLPLCVSSGWLIKSDDETHRIASDFNFNIDGTINEVGNTTIIPTSVVKKIVKLEIL